MWRPGEGIPRLRAFDYWYYDERRDEYGNVRKTCYWHSCAIALVGGSWPLLTIEPETVLDRIGHHVGLPDIDLESEEFNRMFAVHCEDRRFATTLLDPQMMAVLMRTGGAVSFELRGRWLLVHVDRAASKLLPGLLKVAEDFVDAIPKVVWDLYPSPSPGPRASCCPRRCGSCLRRPRSDDDDPWDVLERSPSEPSASRTGPSTTSTATSCRRSKRTRGATCPGGARTAPRKLTGRGVAGRGGAGARVPGGEGADGPRHVPADAQLARERVQPELEPVAGRVLRRRARAAHARPAQGRRARAVRPPVARRAHDQVPAGARRAPRALDGEELAVLSVLMLRGPQTVGELRTRTERLHAFASARRGRSGPRPARGSGGAPRGGARARGRCTRTCSSGEVGGRRRDRLPGPS